MALFTLLVELASGANAIIGLIKDVISWIQTFNKTPTEKTKALKDLHAAVQFYKKTGNVSQLQILHEQSKKGCQQGEL